MIALDPVENGESLSINQADPFDASILIVFLALRGCVREDRSVVKARQGCCWRDASSRTPGPAI